MCIRDSIDFAFRSVMHAIITEMANQEQDRNRRFGDNVVPFLQ